ncbi:MAG: DUF5677 domain-containing protein [Endomicrobiaceae bacterium]|nr:DUF5677 domain-containing protein [Endomicrobiaceae bacterium]
MEDLDVIATRNIKEQRKKIEFLLSKFRKRIQPCHAVNKHTITFGMLLAEYVLRIKTDSIDTYVDNILLNCRRLCEVFIVSRYMNKNNNFEEFIDYCTYDRYDYLENLKKMTEANKKMFPELKNLFSSPKFLSDEQDRLINQHGNKGKKIPAILEMAKDIGYEEEYSYFYKITSKLLHFCPFSFNGDMLLESKDEKFVFFKRIEMYLTEIKKELDVIYEKTKIEN